ncbi:calcium/proton exchanger [Tanacetum coccineum]
MKELNDTNLHDMSYEHLKEIALRSNQDIGDMLKVGYENRNAIDMYVEHFGDCEEIDNVEFHTKGDESIVIKDISTSDPFLNKLCSARIMFRGTTEHIQTETPLVDPDENQIDAVNKVKSGVHYPAFDPDIPWDKMQPTLGMRYETPQQLKLALANYGVANGYQLWYMKNDWREVLVYCGRNVEEGRCAGKKGNKDRVMPNKVRSGVKKKVIKKQIVKKKVVKKQTVKKTTVLDSGEGTSQQTKWTKKQIQDSKKVVCPFRLYASWMSNEHSFQIKSLISEHKCCRNYNLGALVTYRWIALQYFKEIIEDPFVSLRKMRDDIRQKFMIDVSLGQCTRAKQLALFDNEGGLIEHYGKLYQYRQALLESNPGSTCRLDVDESANGSATFRRIYICFKGVKDGWLAGCRKGWFLHLLHDDLSLNDGNGITIISDSHKGLIDAVNDWLPEAKHRKYTRHIYANFKKKYSRLQYQRIFWAAASCTLEQQRCVAFKNGISESSNRAILIPRHKPIITMLEEIRLYIMQRLAAMNKVAFSLEDRITPSIRKRLEILKEKQREWTVFPSGFQELEIRKGDHSYGVNLQHKVCQCRMRELSGVPCVHAVAAYLHVEKDLDLGVSHWYSQESWFNAYQFSIKLVFGSNMWKRTSDVRPLPPLVRTMLGRPQKARIKAPGETSSSHTSRVGRTMTCTNCWQKGHNKATCRGRGRSINEASGSGMGTSGGGTGDGGTSSRGGGTTSRGRGRGRRGGGTTSSGGRRGGGRGSRGVGSTRGGGMAGSSSMGILTAEEEYQVERDEEAFRECMQEQAREQAKIDVEQERLDKERREEQEREEMNDYFNPANWREDSMEEAPFNTKYAEVLIPSIHNLPTQQSGVWVKDTTDVTFEDIGEAPAMTTSETTDVAEASMLEESIVDKGKGKESPADEASGTKRKRGRPPSHVDGIRIYHKNRGRSERIANMKLKKPFQFDKHGTGSTPEKAFDVDD